MLVIFNKLNIIHDLVNKGAKVQEGQQIGNVGNSGNTTEPHLHIHAERDGREVPIRFNGRFLVRNQLVRFN
ncbi:M23 family metallopeptidase [Aeribacillus sp. FSL K6-8394]|uniref:M23 family metallopeptidase n=1 Tax=Aeribacillus sp. FSL K6-8394 TaxID=2954570 RepID=UPI0030FC99DA